MLTSNVNAAIIDAARTEWLHLSAFRMRVHVSARRGIESDCAFRWKICGPRRRNMFNWFAFAKFARRKNWSGWNSRCDFAGDFGRKRLTYSRANLSSNISIGACTFARAENNS
jgi:hypothetical protein